MTLSRSELWYVVNSQLIRRGRTGQLIGRSQLVPEVDEPTQDNTGLLPGTTLTTYSGDLTASTAGAVYDSLDIHGVVKIRAANVTLNNCRVRGETSWPTTTGAGGLVDCTNAACVNATITNNLLRPDVASYYAHGIQGHGYTAKWNNVSGVVDFFGVFNGATGQLNVTIQQNYGWGHSYFTPDPNHASTDNQTHNDGVQIQGGTGPLLIRGNALHGSYDRTIGTTGSLPDRGDGPTDNSTGRYNVGGLAGIQFTPISSQYPVSSSGQLIQVFGNWLYGYKQPLWSGGSSNTDLGYWWRNQFDRTQGLQYSGGDSTGTIGVSPDVTVDTGTGANINVYMDNGHAVTVRRNQ